MRLITFLGTGNREGKYEETTYCFSEDSSEKLTTCYVAHALASFLHPAEVIVLATDHAWKNHGDSLRQRLESLNLSPPQRVPVPFGQTQSELWQQYTLLLNQLHYHGTVALDITHGFRAQPFFASAVVQFAQSMCDDGGDVYVYYGAFEARNKETNETPVWNLTAFVELLHWSRAILLFLRSGRADDIAQTTERLGRELQKQWALGGQQGSQPSLARLGKAIMEFGSDFATVRTGALIANQRSSAQRLLEAIQSAEHEIVQHLPPLASVLQQMIDLVKPLAGSPRLSGQAGQNALQSLAQSYLSMGRFAEAAAVLREGWITRYACSQSDFPGTEKFSDEHREAAEHSWFKNDENTARTLADLRNDIEHAGFRRHPRSPQKIKEQLEGMIREWQSLDGSSQLDTTVNPINQIEAGVVYYHVGVDHPITPDEPLPPLPEIPRGALVIVEGRAPIWRYGMALHRLHGSPAGAVAVFDPRLGAVVVASHHPDWKEGQVIDLPDQGH